MLVLNLKNGVNNRFLRPRYVQQEEKVIFSFGFIPRKTTSDEEIGLTPTSRTGYILNINRA